jgi:CPA1 family monovalent cation:H+ antiporter
MRGALPLAPALALPADLSQRAEIIDAVFATVFVTLVLQGLPLEPVVRRLYPSDRTKAVAAAANMP